MSSRILIADGTTAHRVALRAMMRAARYEVELAETADQAMTLARTTRPDLVLAGDRIALGPDGGLATRLRGDPRTAALPLIVLTGDPTPDYRVAALRAGAADVTSRSGAAATLLARIRSHLRAADMAQALGQRHAAARELGFAESARAFQTAARIALIAHDEGEADRWRNMMAGRTAHPMNALAITDALGEAERSKPADLFVIEARLAHPGEALSLLADLRARPGTRYSAIILVYSREDAETATMALDLGASDLMETGFRPEELALRIDIQLARKRAGDSLRASVDERLRLAMEDPLTGLFNRRYALSHARGESASGRGYSVILADIDHFKTVNDTYGHAAGDAVLVEFARRLRDNVRGMDMVARIGGEEFLVFLPDPDPRAVEAAARRLHAAVRETSFILQDAVTPVFVTASFGIAMGDAAEPLDAAINRADTALYRAKAEGRDTISIAKTCAA